MLKREVIAIALFKRFPDGGWGVTDDTKKFEDIYWQNGTPLISKAEFEQEYILAEVQYQVELARNNRHREYPTIGDQLDDLFKAGVFSEEMSAKIQAIKDKYPKP